MLRIKYWVKNFFGFSRSQVNGFLILLPLTTIILFSEPAWHWWMRSRKIDFTAEQVKLDSLILAWGTQPSVLDSSLSSSKKEKRAYFSFDPNVTEHEDLLSLGISEKVTGRIVNYRRKGGKFRIKSDLLKIYGFDSALYRGLISFIRLPEEFGKAKKTYTEKPYRIAFKKDVVIERFDLNAADTAQLKKIYGIGEKLSLRIVKYRDKLGGFLDMKQLTEVYGLDSVTIGRITEQSIVVGDVAVKKININTSDEKQLAAHPYFSKIAKSMVAYRFQHGEFKSVEDIRNVGTLDENTIQKIIPYLKVNDE